MRLLWATHTKPGRAGFIKTPRVAIIDILKTGILPKSGQAQTGREALAVAIGGFLIEQ